ncbi:MAG: DUF547 domain-containing protein [Ponticaulis sp.]|nr:DUF547 domain-containing protein [Ponticaulis sp.]
MNFRRLVFTVLIVGLSALGGKFSSAQAQTQPIDDLHAAWTEILSEYVIVSNDGINRFDYAALKASESDTAHLNTYITDLAARPLSSLPDDDQFAAWANLYNALTIQVIVENYPVESILDIRSGIFSSGPWKRKLITVEGKKLSLDNIEHDILRVRFDDPRVHYAVNCASIGCPNLGTSAWLAETLDQDLDAAARAYINHPRGVDLISAGTFRISSIYDWYQSDFGGGKAGVLDHIRQYANEELQAKISKDARIEKYGYDWSLNAPEGDAE